MCDTRGMTDSRTLSELHDDAVDLLTRLRDTPKEIQVPVNREIAEAFVEARGHFAKADGRPALDGRAPAYRRFLGEIFDDAGYRPEEKTRTMSALRYHTSIVLHSKYDTETLKEYGIHTDDSRVKSKARRNRRAAEATALTGRQMRGGAMIAITGVHAAVRSVVGGLDQADLDSFDADERAAADGLLADAVDILVEAREKLAGEDDSAA